MSRSKTITLEGFVTGDDHGWRMDISRALDGDERSSMTPLFQIFENTFGHLCTWPDPFKSQARVMQFGAFRITIEAIDHWRNERYREEGGGQGTAESDSAAPFAADEPERGHD